MANFGILRDPQLAASFLGSFDQEKARLQQERMQQMQEAQLRQAMADEESTRQAYQTAGMDQNKLLQELSARGAYRQAQTVQKNILDQRKAKLESEKMIGDIRKQFANQVLANPSEATAMWSLAALNNSTGVPIDDEVQLVKSFNGDPLKIRQWAAGRSVDADKLLPKTDSINAGDRQVIETRDPFGNVTGTRSISVGMSPTGAATADLARAQWAFAKQGKEQDRADKAQAKADKATSELASIDKAMLQLSKAADIDYEGNILPASQGLSAGTGLTGFTPAIPGTAKADWVANLEAFKSQSFLSAIAALKGMGALSDKEGQALTRAVGALERTQSTKAFQESAKQIMLELSNARNRITNTANPYGLSPEGAAALKKYGGG